MPRPTNNICITITTNYHMYFQYLNKSLQEFVRNIRKVEGTQAERRYRSTHTSSLHYMEVSALFHDPAALAPEKNSDTRLLECSVGPRAGMEVLETRNILAPTGIQFPDRPVSSAVAIPTALFRLHRLHRHMQMILDNDQLYTNLLYFIIRLL